MFEIQEIPKKGKGLVATSDIAKGTRILCEEPLIKFPDFDAISYGPRDSLSTDIRHRVKSLPFDKQQEYLTLYNPAGQVGNSKYLSIAKARHLKLESFFPADHYIADKNAGKKDKGVVDLNFVGVFATASRINHACQPNAHSAWNENTKRYTVYATRNIMRGEEITINYNGALAIPSTPNRAFKRSFKKKLGFVCACNLCTPPARQVNAYDEDVSKVCSRTEATLREFTGTCMLFGVPPVSLPGYGDCMRYVCNADMHKLLENIDWNARIYKSYGTRAALATSMSWAAKVCSLYGDLARANVFWKWAAHKWRKLEGEDSPKFIYCKEQGQNTRRLSNHKNLEKWWSGVDDVPEGLEYEDDKRVFEAWLWARPPGYLGPDKKAGLKAHVVSIRSKCDGTRGRDSECSWENEIAVGADSPLLGDFKLKGAFVMGE